MASRRQDGYSLLEMLITTSIILIVGGITFVSMQPVINQSHVDSAYETTLEVLRDTRNLAITQGHEYYVNFNPGGFPAGTIQVQYQPPQGGAAALPPLQQVMTYTIPADISYSTMASFPAATPDGFNTAAIDFGYQLAGEPENYIVFMPDGSSQDGLGNYSSGVIYIVRPADTNPYHSRAVTVWGATGRIRGWRLDQIGAGEWVQQ